MGATPAGAKGVAWYALHLRSNQEKRARDFLQRKSIEAFLPLYRVASRRRDRKVVVDKPLFTGYLFVRTALERDERIQILRAPGAVGMVGFEEGPEPVPDADVEAVRTLIGSGRDPVPFPFLNRGRRVRVVGGPLNGLVGFIVDAADGKRKVVVSIEILGRSVAARLEREELEPAGD